MVVAFMRSWLLPYVSLLLRLKTMNALMFTEEFHLKCSKQLRYVKPNVLLVVVRLVF